MLHMNHRHDKKVFSMASKNGTHFLVRQPVVKKKMKRKVNITSKQSVCKEPTRSNTSIRSPQLLVIAPIAQNEVFIVLYVVLSH